MVTTVRLTDPPQVTMAQRRRPYLMLTGSPRSGLEVTLVTSCEDFVKHFPNACEEDRAVVVGSFLLGASELDIIHGPGST